MPDQTLLTRAIEDQKKAKRPMDYCWWGAIYSDATAILQNWSIERGFQWPKPLQQGSPD